MGLIGMTDCLGIPGGIPYSCVIPEIDIGILPWLSESLVFTRVSICRGVRDMAV